MDNKYMHHASLLQHQRMQQQQQFEERILEHLAFNSDILERWHHIGTSQGLTTDLEVATFLVQHYENTWDRAQPIEFCLTCHSPLSLSCPKCSAIANGNGTPTPSSHGQPDPLPGLFGGAGDNGVPYSLDPLPAKGGKKRKKSSRKGEGEAGGSQDTDDELLGLYIQFGQPHVPTSSPDLDLGPHGRSPTRKKQGGKGSRKKNKADGGDNNGAKLKSYVCVHCGKTIYKLSDFKKHVRTHTREKPYKCQYCESAFSDASSAARHRRVHTGEKPFRCSLCPAAFAQSSDLTKHLRVHTQERPWQCQVCQKTFSDSSRFAHHRRQHDKAAAAAAAAASRNGKTDAALQHSQHIPWLMCVMDKGEPDPCLPPDPSGGEEGSVGAGKDMVMTGVLQRMLALPGTVTLPAASVMTASIQSTGKDISVPEGGTTAPVVMEMGVYQQWRQFGIHQGLSNDSHIAAFLLNHYETTQSMTRCVETSHSVMRCVNCPSMPSLYCSKCVQRGHTSPSTTPTAAPSGPLTSVTPATFRVTLSSDCASAAVSQSPPLSGSQAESVSPPQSKAGGRRGLRKGKKEEGGSSTCQKCGTQVAPPPPHPHSSSSTTTTTTTSTNTRRRSGGGRGRDGGGGGGGGGGAVQQPYRCAVCQLAFPYRQALQEHLFARTAEGAHRCRHCHLVVLNGGDVRKHLLQHMGPMPFNCPHCPLAFSLSCNLKTHLRTHSGEKPFTCQVCGRGFSQSIALKVHVRKHTGERPFKCPHCPMAFAASSNLSRHVLKHTGQRPYRCSYCTAAFSQPGSLKTHTRSKHTGERPYRCDRCCAAFSDHSTLWKHRRNNTCGGGGLSGGVWGGGRRKTGAAPSLEASARVQSSSGGAFTAVAGAAAPPPTVSVVSLSSGSRSGQEVSVLSGSGQEGGISSRSGKEVSMVSVSGQEVSISSGSRSGQEVSMSSGSRSGQEVAAFSLAGCNMLATQALYQHQAPQTPQQVAVKLKEQPVQHLQQHLQQQHQLHQQQQLQEQQQQQQQQQQAGTEGAAFVSGVEWCFPVLHT
ncbi:uncharacterized protein LOC143277575 [Babylonia areolata]|uniref:uncharacterized protein LOC143277575 n=1 Tax=Babylonia areolata TaxID=304850 RepID=UPI003FD25F32